MKNDMERQQIVSDNKGLTLIEVLIAISILSIGMLVAIPLLTSSIQNNKIGNVKTEAMVLALSMIEQIAEQNTADLAIGTTLENDIDESGNPGGIYDRSTNVGNLQLDDGSNSALARIVTVTVSWPGSPNNRAGNIALTSYVMGDGS